MDLVTNLPGFGEPISPVFSGYLNVQRESAISNIFYVYVEKEKDSAPAPESAEDFVIFWGQGGPGCSSMLGLFMEMGPWRPADDGTLKSNKYSWSKLASMVFIDSPVGAGWSFESETSERLQSNDALASQDFVAAVSLWFERYPEKAHLPFFFASESYGGHFCIQWANLVSQSSKFSHLQNRFSGFLIGNPFVSFESGDLSFAATLWGRQLISRPVWERYVDKKCHLLSGIYTATNYPKDCVTLLETVIAEKDSTGSGSFSNISPYNLNTPVCSSESAQSRRVRMLLRNRNASSYTYSKRRNLLGSPDDYDFDPCIELHLVAYLNRQDVRKALHVDDRASAWTQCSDDIFFNWPSMDSYADTTSLFENMILRSTNLRIMIFSGDADGVCATVGTQNWIWRVAGDRKIIDYWNPWVDITGQQAGFVTRWERQFSFVTVHAAGHEVPLYQPRRAFSLLQGFLNGAMFANVSSLSQGDSTIQQAPNATGVNIMLALFIPFLALLSLLFFVKILQRGASAGHVSLRAHSTSSSFSSGGSSRISRRVSIRNDTLDALPSTDPSVTKSSRL